MWSPFGIELLTQFTICSLYIMSICNFSYFSLCFEGGTLVLIASVPDHCVPFTFYSV